MVAVVAVAVAVAVMANHLNGPSLANAYSLAINQGVGDIARRRHEHHAFNLLLPHELQEVRIRKRSRRGLRGVERLYRVRAHAAGDGSHGEGKRPLQEMQ